MLLVIEDGAVHALVSGVLSRSDSLASSIAERPQSDLRSNRSDGELRDSPEKGGVLNGSAQHLLEVYRRAS